MEDPAQQPEEVPLLHPAVGGSHAWLQAVPIKWILLGVLTVVVLCAIGLLSAGSLDYHVWIETVVGMDAKQRQSALFSLAGDATTLFLVYAPMYVFGLCTILNATLWTVYARIIKDNLMLFPSATGVALSLCQVFQRCLYHFYMPAGELQAWVIGIWNAWFRGHGGNLIGPNNNDPAGEE